MKPRRKEFSSSCAPKLRPSHDDLQAAGLDRFDGLPDDSPCGEGRALLALRQWLLRPETQSLMDLLASMAHSDFRRSGVPYADEIEIDEFIEVWLNRRHINVEPQDCEDYQRRRTTGPVVRKAGRAK